MDNLLEQFQSLPPNSQIYALAIGLPLVFLAVYLGLQIVANWVRGWFVTDEQESLPLVRNPFEQTGPRGWLTEINDRFELLMANSGTGVSAELGWSWILLMGTVGAVGLFAIQLDPWMALLGFAIGTLGTYGYFAFQAGQNRWKIQEQMPDLLFMIARSSRAGLALEKSLELVSEQPRLALATDFRRCMGQIDLGLSVVASLRYLADRLNLMDFNSFVATVTMYQNTGGNLPTMLERLAISVRDHNQFKGFVRSTTALGRITSIAIAIATPAIFVGYFFLMPEWAKYLVETSQGWTVLAIAFGLEAIGLLWLAALLRVDY